MLLQKFKQLFKVKMRGCRNSIYASPFVYSFLNYSLKRDGDKRLKGIKNFVSILVVKIIGEEQIGGMINDAEHYLSDEYSLFGVNNIKLSGNKWNIDYKTGYRWEEGKYYLQYKTVDYANHSDVKFPWDMSRCHHMLTLGEAYMMTGDEKYASKIKDDYYSWLKYNPFLKSINWTCAMDVAIRATNWLYAFSMIRESNELDKDLWENIAFSLKQHAFFIEHNLEKGDEHSGNHFIANVCGLLHIYAALGVRGKKWQKLLVQFEYEVNDQILPSGFHYEKSTSYHRLVLEMLFYTAIMLKKNGVVVSDKVNSTINLMTHFLDNIIQPDGSIPLIGDNDNGRFLPFSSTGLLDYRYLISLAADYFPNEQYIHLSPTPVFEPSLILGKEARLNVESPQLQSSYNFYRDSSLCVLKAKDNFALIHNNPVSKCYIERNDNAIFNSHTHFDLLSFVLSMCGERIVIDPGTLCYTSSPDKRNLYRSTQMHNTIVVGGRNQQNGDLKSMFKMHQYSYPTKCEYTDADGFMGEYEYRESSDVKYSHNRRLRLSDKDCIISDIVKTIKTESVISYLHLDPTILVHIDGDVVLLKTGSNKVIRLVVSSSLPNKISCLPSVYSPSYGTEENTNVLVIDYMKVCGELRTEMKFTLE